MKTFIAQAVDASAVQQALPDLGTPAPLHLFPPDEQVGFERRAVISSRTDTDPDHGKLRSDSDIIRCSHQIPLRLIALGTILMIFLEKLQTLSSSPNLFHPPKPPT